MGTLLQMGHYEAGFDLSALFLHPKGMLEALDLAAGTRKIILFFFILYSSIFIPHCLFFIFILNLHLNLLLLFSYPLLLVNLTPPCAFTYSYFTPYLVSTLPTWLSL